MQYIRVPTPKLARPVRRKASVLDIHMLNRKINEGLPL